MSNRPKLQYSLETFGSFSYCVAFPLVARPGLAPFNTSSAVLIEELAPLPARLVKCHLY